MAGKPNYAVAVNVLLAHAATIRNQTKDARESLHGVERMLVDAQDPERDVSEETMVRVRQFKGGLEARIASTQATVNEIFGAIDILLRAEKEGDEAL